MLIHSVTTSATGSRSPWTHCSRAVAGIPEDRLVEVTPGSGAGWLRVTCPLCQARSALSFNQFTSPATV